MTGQHATPHSRAALLLRAAARGQQGSNGARLRCLHAADHLDPRTGLAPTKTATPDPAELIRAALRILASLPAEQFTDDVRAATVHARRALREPGTPDGHVAG